MTGRPDLRLSREERDVLVDQVLAVEPVAWATVGDDGYPLVGLVRAERDDAHLVYVGGEAPPAGVPVCVIIERGATYDDITAVVARGTTEHGRLALDDLVTFAFAKARPAR